MTWKGCSTVAQSGRLFGGGVAPALASKSQSKTNDRGPLQRDGGDFACIWSNLIKMPHSGKKSAFIVLKERHFTLIRCAIEQHLAFYIVGFIHFPTRSILGPFGGNGWAGQAPGVGGPGSQGRRCGRGAAVIAAEQRAKGRGPCVR